MAAVFNIKKQVLAEDPGGTDGINNADEIIIYGFEFSNDSTPGTTEDFLNPILVDPLLGDPIDIMAAVDLGLLRIIYDIGNTDDILETDEVWTITPYDVDGVTLLSDLFTYAVTQEDFDTFGDDSIAGPDGDIDNTATVFITRDINQELLEASGSAAVDLVLEPSIDIEKFTNDEDADTETGPFIAVDEAVNWTYEVTNNGNVALNTVVVTDSEGEVLTREADIVGNNDDVLDVDEVWLFSASNTAVAGQYMNLGDVVAFDPAGGTVLDEDPSHYFGVDLSIDIEKFTNGEDADTETGPLIGVGEAVNWTYEVTNDGNVDLINVVVTDSEGEVLTREADIVGNNDDVLDVDEVWLFSASNTAVAGQYMNLGDVVAVDPLGEDVTDEDPSHYFGGNSSIDIEKFTNGEDADTETGPLIAVGEAVNWTYEVTNDGDFDLINVVVTDSEGEVLTREADIVGNNDDVLDVDEVWLFSASNTAVAGQYMNLGDVVAVDPLGEDVTDEDPSHYFGVDSSIDIEKFTNGEDADTETGPLIGVGEAVNWTYEVTNDGNVDLINVVVTDSEGEVLTREADIVGNNDDVLDVDEVWLFSASNTAVAGQYMNLGDVVAVDPLGEDVTDEDPSHYFGEELEPGCANTPGFWKNKVNKETDMSIFEQETGFDANDVFYEDLFDVDVTGWKKVVTNPTLQQALEAKGGGESALLRASTAAYANIESDDANYSFAFHAGEGDFSATSLATLEAIDTSENGAIEFDELYAAVQDAFDEVPGPLEFGDLATALDDMNNVLPACEEYHLPIIDVLV